MGKSLKIAGNGGVMCENGVKWLCYVGKRWEMLVLCWKIVVNGGVMWENGEKCWCYVGKW